MSSDNFTRLQDIPAIVQRLRDSSEDGVMRPLKIRYTVLRQIGRMVQQNESQFVDAMNMDLGRSKLLAQLLDINPIITDISEHLENLELWSKDEPRSGGLLFALDSVSIRKEPKGVVAVIGAWNFPLQLLLRPVVAAVAAGNAVVMKPSEVATHTGSLIAKLVPKYCKPEHVAVIYGGVKETSVMLDHRFDHIMYTGSTAVGRIIMQAAAKHLTPVTLELGGKCPVVVGPDVNIPNMARRVIWGKLMNCGQTCISPDYLICPEKKVKAIVEEMRKATKEFYGQNPAQAQDYGKIINEHHWERLAGMLDERGLQLEMLGPEPDREQRFIPPVLVINPDENAKLLQEEIFGPILPIIPVKEIYKDSVKIIRRHPNPLALYIFSDEQTLQDYVLDHCNSGAVVINDTIMHFAAPLPFGGVGQSGMGAYHGEYGFNEFSHRRGVLHRYSGIEFVNKPRYPPHTEQTTAPLRFLMNSKAKF